MQNSYGKFGKYSDVLDTDFSNWDDDFFSENSQFSDVENTIDAKNLIKSLQSTTNKINNKTDGNFFCRDEIFQRGVVETLSCKNIKSSKFGNVNASWNYISQKKHKQIHISTQKEHKSKARKHVRESSDSDDFCSPNKKYKRSKTSTKNIFLNSSKISLGKIFDIYSSKTYENSSESIIRMQNTKALKSQDDIMTISNQEFPDNQNADVSSQESTSSKMITSSQEISSSQKMSISSQEISSSQKMSISSQEISSSQKMSISSQEISSSQKMSISSQEISASQNMSTSSQDISASQKVNTESQETSIIQKMGSSRHNFSTSQTMITSSQENPGSQNISSSPELCNSPNIITSSQESLGKQVMGICIEENSSVINIIRHLNSEIYPNGKKLNCQQSDILNHGTVNLDTLSIHNNQQSPSNGTVSNEKIKIGLSEKDNHSENFKSTISDSFCIKTGKNYDKQRRRKIWSIRKRELEVTKRENAIEIREKLLDSREADIQKREQILKAKEQRYLRLKTSMRKFTKKSNISSKKYEEKIRCLRR